MRKQFEITYKGPKDWRSKAKGRVLWLDIPEHLRKHVIRRCEP